MHIVQLANFYGPRSGGLRTALDKLGTGYVEQGHRVTLVVAGEYATDEMLASGVRRIAVPAPRFLRVEGYRAANSIRIRKWLNRLQPDSVEVSDRLTMRGVGPWAKAHGVGNLMVAHERLDRLFALGVPSPVATFGADIANRGSMRSFDTIVATTAFAGEEFVRVGAPNLRHVSLGVDLTTFHPRRRTDSARQRWAQDAKVLLVHSGRLSMEKCPQRSVDAVRLLHRRGLSVRLVVAGDGPMLEQLRCAATDIPVEFAGFIGDRTELASLLACADYAISPGPHETFGLAAMECLASGTPAVVSESSALAQLVTSSSGRCAPDTAEGFADALTSMILSHNELQSHSARAQAEQFGWERAIDSMLALHRESASMRHFARRWAHNELPRRNPLRRAS